MGTSEIVCEEDGLQVRERCGERGTTADEVGQ